MKKLISILLIVSINLFSTGFVSNAFAQTETIATVDVAKDLAEKAGGIFVEGDTVPALTGDQVALPIIEEETGNIVGHIVADRASLVAALEEAGYSDVASAIAAGTAGAAAGGTVGAGFFSGTTGIVALVIAGVVGIGLAIGGGGGGGGGSTSGHQ